MLRYKEEKPIPNPWNFEREKATKQMRVVEVVNGWDLKCFGVGKNAHWVREREKIS